MSVCVQFKLKDELAYFIESNITADGGGSTGMPLLSPIVSCPVVSTTPTLNQFSLRTVNPVVSIELVSTS